MLYEIKKALESLGRPGIRTDFTHLLRNAFYYYASPAGQAAPPLSLYWCLNSVCNLKCRMCDIGAGNTSGTFFRNLVPAGRAQEIDIRVFKSVVEEMKKFRPLIAMVSTEPLLYADLAEAVAYASKQGLKTSVTTGGYTLEQRARDLALSGLDYLHVSLDGPPEIHNTLRGRSDSFEKAAAGILAFHKACQALGRNPKIEIDFTFSNGNDASLPDLLNALKPIPYARININHLYFLDETTAQEQNRLFGNRFEAAPSCMGDGIDPGKINVNVMRDHLQFLKHDSRIRILNNFSFPQLTRYYHQPHRFVYARPLCMASWFFAQILADGSVGVFTRCHNQRFGNINEKPFLDIWNGPEMRAWRRFIRRQKVMPMCKRCDLVN